MKIFNLIKKFFNTNVSFLILITIVVFCLYGKVINYELLSLDDKISISANINFISNVKNLPKLFLTDCYYSKDSYKHQSYYRPILTLTFAIETLLFGQNSKVYHITNILLFILSIYLIYLFLLKLNINKIIIIFVLLLLCVAPLFTSNVAYTSPRGETLLTIFTILIFINIIQYLKNNKLYNFIFIIIFFTLSLLTKESAIVSLLTVPIFLYSFNYKIVTKQNLFIFLSLIIIVILYFLLRKIAVANIEINTYLNHFDIISVNIINGFTIFINKLLIPFYIPVVLYNYLPNTLEYLVAIFFCFLLVIIFYKKIIDRKVILFGLSIFILYLLPTFLISESQIFFHRLLLPSIGLTLILSKLILTMLKKYNFILKYIVFLWIILFIIFCYISFIQLDKYKNDILFAINGYKDAPTYHIFTGLIGNLYAQQQDYDKALEFYYLAEKNAPFKYLNNIATILCYQNKFDEAEKILKKSILGNKNKEVCYANLSLIYENKKNYSKALEYALLSYNENPYNIDLSINLARIYRLNNKFYEAIEIYTNLIKFNNKKSNYYYSLGILYNDLNDRNNSIKFLQKACELEPNNEKYTNKLEEISK